MSNYREFPLFTEEEPRVSDFTIDDYEYDNDDEPNTHQYGSPQSVVSHETSKASQSGSVSSFRSNITSSTSAASRFKLKATTPDYNEKIAFFEELTSLRQKIRHTEKEKYKPLTNARVGLKNEMEKLEKFENTCQKNRVQEKDLLISNVGEIRKRVAEVGRLITADQFEQIQVELLQENIEKTESILKNFKIESKRMYADILEEETTLSREVELLAGRFEGWENEAKAPKPLSGNISRRPLLKPGSSRVSTRGTPSKRASSVSSLRSTPNKVPENKENLDEMDRETEYRLKIKSVENQISQLGGVGCGWDNSDHSDFLKLRTMHKGRLTIAFINACLTTIPNKLEDDIRQHFKTHEAYLHLNDEKKDLLKKYKEVKLETKSRVQSKYLMTIEKQEEEAEKVERSKIGIKTKEQQEETRQQIKKWREEQKVAKEREIQVEEEKKQQREQARKERLERERERKRQQVEDFKIKKEVEQLRKKKDEQISKMQHRRAPSAHEKERIRMREEAAMLARKQKIEQKRREEIERQERNEKFKHKSQGMYKFVGSRLEEKTTALKVKERTKHDPTVDGQRIANTFGGQILHAGRAIPSWRQGI
mmetsp:Transcript_31961/g.36347  ORF Transcript_31961/g.36347 Transcript_31961/m.36347 type:complete len:595 (+) Transcript_31961:106-1890(+)